MTRTEHIAQFVYNLKYEDLPPGGGAGRQEHDHGCPVRGRGYHPRLPKGCKGHLGHGGALRRGSGGHRGGHRKKDARPLCRPWANATLTHGLDFDDTHKESLCHTSASVVASALAIVEEVGGTGKT